MRIRQGRALVVVAAFLMLATAGGVAHAQCGPMDVVFIIDNSASMLPVIDNVKSQVNQIADAVTAASGGDYQFGLVTMPSNDVVIALDMSAKNRAALATAVNTMTNVSSLGAGIAYDEALDSVLNHLGPRKGSIGQQTGTFTGTFRPNATKIIMIITDSNPQGFDSDYLTHPDHAYAMASEANSMGVLIAGIFVPDGGGTNQVVDEPILQNVAAITGGAFEETLPDASDLSNVIIDVVNACGSGSGLIIAPTEIALSNGESADLSVTNFHPGDVSTLVMSSDGLPSDSTVTFANATPTITGTNLQTMHVTIGPDTPAGVFILNVHAGHTGSGSRQSNFVLVNVDCTPPLILGKGQPSSTTVGSTVAVNPVGSLGLHYQWYRGHSGSTAFPIAGATASSFKPTQAGEYWVRVSNACGSTNSATAVVH
jgi:von Willebrand factor type A domain-containing protein